MRKGIILFTLAVCFFISSTSFAVGEYIEQHKQDILAYNSKVEQIFRDIPEPLQKADSALIDKVYEKGTVPVIVRLREDDMPYGLFSDRSTPRDQIINSLQETVLNEVIARTGRDESKLHVKRFTIIPGMALQVGPEEIEALLDNPNVIDIVEDRADFPTLMDSAPLIGAGPDGSFGNNGYAGDGWVIAILDTRVEKGHPFLGGKVVSEACYSTNLQSEGVSSLCPGSAAESTAPGSGTFCIGASGCSHGTHVAGIAAGKDQSSGLYGVAREAKIISIQVFSRVTDVAECSPYPSPCVRTFLSDQILGLERVYALRNNYNIAAVNMSLGIGQYFDPCNSDRRKENIDQLRAAGIATVIASGNDGYKNSTYAPACIESAISVGSTSKTDGVSWFSNSAYFLSLLAPGGYGDNPPSHGDIYSSIPGGNYDYDAGTSMSAPHVAGAWAVLKQAFPSAGVTEVLEMLQTTGVPVTDTRSGANNRVKRRINLATALPPRLPATPSYPSSSTTGIYPVSWSGSVGATSYGLQRSRDGGSTWEYAYSGVDTSFSESVSSGSYRYRVRARNTAGESDWRTGTHDCVVTFPGGASVTVTYNAVAHAHIASFAPDQNYGDEIFMSVLRINDVRQLGLIRFGSMNLPTGTNIESASLKMYAYNGRTTVPSIAAFFVGGSWTESGVTGVTWNTAPVVVSPPEAIVATFPALTEYYAWISIDVTSFVREWVSRPQSNNGVALIANSTDMMVGIRSRNHPTSSQRPYLEVRFSETISTPSSVSGPSSGQTGESFDFTASGASSNVGHSIEYQFNWGDGTESTWGSGSRSKTYSAPGNYGIRARARCQNHREAVSAWSGVLKTVVISPAHTVNTPNTPSGPNTGFVGTSYEFATGGSSCTHGHAVQYEFDWRDGSQSGWGGASAFKLYNNPGTYDIRARARCAVNTSIVSGWSANKSIVISSPPSYALIVTADGASSVVINSSSGHGGTTPYERTILQNTEVVLEAPEYVGSGTARKRFVEWTGAVNSQQKSISFDMVSATELTANYVDDPSGGTVDTPVFNPDGGSHPGSSVNVIVSCSTAGATIRYTTNGSEPTESSPIVASGGSVSVSVPGTLTAKAWKDGMIASETKTAHYNNIALINVAASVNGGIATAESEGTYGETMYVSRVNDGDHDTDWANSGTMPSWAQVEFDAVYKISKVAVLVNYHQQTFDVNLSSDGVNWAQVVGPTLSNNPPQNPELGGGRVYHSFNITPQNAKYIRVNITTSTAPPSHIFKAILTEIEAYAAYQCFDDFDCVEEKVCNVDTGECVECLNDNHCDPDYRCDDNVCVLTSAGTMRIDRANVRAGKIRGADRILFSGTLNATVADLIDAVGGTITVILAAEYVPDLSKTTFTFQVPAASVSKGKYKSPKDPVARLLIDTIKGTMRFAAKNVDLTGIGCPITVEIQFGDYAAITQIGPGVVNGRKPCPLPLMMGVKDTLDVNRVRARKGRTTGTDSITIRGGFTAAGGFNAAQPVIITLGPDTFTIPGNDFILSNGRYLCKKVDIGNAIVMARFDTVKCTYSINIRGADITGSGNVVFGLNVFGNALPQNQIRLPFGF